MKKLKKVSVFQPIRGKTEKDIVKEREVAVEQAKKKVKEVLGYDDVEIIDSFIVQAALEHTDSHTLLWYLSQAIAKLSEADVAYFADGWEHDRECRVEHFVAKEFGIQILYGDCYE